MCFYWSIFEKMHQSYFQLKPLFRGQKVGRSFPQINSLSIFFSTKINLFSSIFGLSCFNILSAYCILSFLKFIDSSSARAILNWKDGQKITMKVLLMRIMIKRPLAQPKKFFKNEHTLYSEEWVKVKTLYLYLSENDLINWD